MPEEAHAVLLVSPYSTECSGCGKGASPQDTHHTEIVGYAYGAGPRPAGCGARFVAIAAKWSVVTSDALRRLRPDLPISPAGGTSPTRHVEEGMMPLMKITLELGDTGEQIHTDLPAVPRIGEQLLRVDDATHEVHGDYQRMREYRVQMVDWTMSKGNEASPLILVRLDFLEDISGLPDDDTSSAAVTPS
ncbi:hypothetical protein [Streptomyces sp. NPDC004042]|uniref:hypothetical protein n=1 Tax=Streptomyces sp. NPDC004042 TaxID=3154451 RepID=UPI0033B3132F